MESKMNPNFNLRAWLPSRGNVVFTLLVVGSLFWAASAGAFPLAAPLAAGTSTGTIAYQGRLADSGGNPLTGTYTMAFRLYSTAGGGAPLWTEEWTGSNSVQVSDGLFNVMLGSLAPIPQSVITGNSNLWLGVTVGTDDEMAPRVQLGSVPFAVQALTVPDGSVTTAKIADGAVTQAKLGSDVGLLPPGTIVMWSGPISSIPEGWALCDGTQGTPDLRDRFILGISAGENPGATGGSNSITLSVSQLPPHTHTGNTNAAGAHSHTVHIRIVISSEHNNDGGFSFPQQMFTFSDLSTSSDGNHIHSFTTDSTGSGAPIDIRPAYYKLAFIMKLATP